MLEWVKALWPVIPSVAVVTLWFNLRDARRRRAAGSLLIVTGGVDRRMVRWAKLSLKSWTDTPIRLKHVRVLWPLAATCYLYKDETEAKLSAMYDRSINLPIGRRSIELMPPVDVMQMGPTPLAAFVVVSEKLRRSRPSRLYLRITGETLDAQRRRVALMLRSEPVDWSKPPQE
jgi:hypothetical protein